MKKKMDDPRIDTAIKTYPVVNLPPGFVQRTMQRINIEVRFQWQFIDIVLPVFFFLFALSIFVILAWLLQMINPLWLPQAELQIQMTLLIMPTWAKWLGVGSAFLGAIVVGVVLISAFVIISRPQNSHNTGRRS
jgi:hypothetical protein